MIDADDLQLRPTEITATSTPANETVETTTTESTAAPTSEVSTLDNYLEEIEKQAILKALEETRWNRTAAAEKLGISFRQIRHRLKKFGIE